MKNYDYLIVGAGLFGSVFAHEAQKRGKKCLVIDKRNHIGGNVYTKKIEDINVHMHGAHIFHTSNEKIWTYVNKFTKFNNFINSPMAISNGKMYNLPFNMNTFYQLWGTQTPDEARKIIEKQTIESNVGMPNNLEEQALKLVGKDVYKTLIKEYTEKQWGRECTDLPAFIIRRLPIRYTFDNNYFDDIYQGIPIDGYTEIFEKLLYNCDILLETNYKDIVDDEEINYSKIIYTGPIDEYYNYLYGALEYRSLEFDTYVLDSQNYQGNAVINYIDKSYKFTRVIEHKHFEFGKQLKTVITKEYPKEWKEYEEPYYPINDQVNNEKYAKYLKLSNQSSNVIFGGRLGTYKYLNMDQVICLALELVENELDCIKTV